MTGDVAQFRDAGGSALDFLFDQVGTLNGGAIAQVRVQRMKVGFGSDGALRDVDEANPLPVQFAGGASEATLEAVRALAQAIREAVRLEDSAHASGHAGMMMLGVRQDAEGGVVGDDGDYAPLLVNEYGRLKVAAQPGIYPLVQGNITANGQSVACDVSRASNVMVHMVAAGLSGHACVFEGSVDSTNGTDGAWFGIQAVRSNANTIETGTGTLAATPGYGWELSVNGLAWVRIRATGHSAGTATWKLQRAPYATEPIPAAQISGTQPVSGSVTATLAAATVRAGFVAGSGVWYDDSSTALAANAGFTGTARDATQAATGAAFANAATFAQEVRAIAESDVAGTLWLEVSRDGTNWRRIRSVATAAVAGGGQAAELVYRPAWRHWRVGYTNGAAAQARFALGSVAMAI